MIDSKAIYKNSKNLYLLKNLSNNLHQDIEFLVRSLGFQAFTKYEDNVKVLYFRPPENLGIPVLINNKTNNNTSEFAPSTYKFQIESVGEDNYYGFTVDGDHLYLTDDFLVHHNCGGNGKSKIIELFELAFGDYCGKLSVTNVTQKDLLVMPVLQSY